MECITEAEEIMEAIKKAGQAIAYKKEAANLLLSAHKQASDFTHLKSIYIFNKGRNIVEFTRNYANNYVDKYDAQTKPDYERAKAGLEALEDIKNEANRLLLEYRLASNVFRRRQLEKMIRMKRWEMERIGYLQEAAETVAQEALDKLVAVEPLVAKAYKSANQNIDKTSWLLNFSIILSLQTYLLKVFPIIFALSITFLIDSMTGTFEVMFKPIDAKGYHDAAILTLFAIQWVLFDRAKDYALDKFHNYAVAKLARDFSDKLAVIQGAEADLTAAQGICNSLAKEG
jgi:hypothetical protein